MEPRINYVIATWSGNRRAPDNNYLKKHLIKLLSLKHNLSQITIVKPVLDGCEETYYDVNKIIDKFDCKVEILEKYSNTGQSYGQLFYSYEKYGNSFDYYIFIEDDYIPAIDNFDKILLNEYISQNTNGYLCSYMGVNKEYPIGGCSVSNGIMSSKYFEIIYNKIKNPIENINGAEGHNCHKNFTDLILRSGLNFSDFSKSYRVPYFADKVIEYGRTDISESIFVPSQIFDIDFNFIEMNESDLEEFLIIRNDSRGYLHNDRVFKIEETREWFKKENPIFFMIKLNDKNIGYFRTSNWDLINGILYIGADLDKDFRGYKLAQIAYKKFLKKLFSDYNLKTVLLEVLSINARAIHLYKKLGFVEIHKEINYVVRDGVNVDNILMTLTKENI